MKLRGNSWLLVLLAAGGAAIIYGVLVWSRLVSDPTLADILQRLPDRDAATVHVNVAALRGAGLGALLENSPVTEEPEYRRFVTESGFDWKTDLEAVTACKQGPHWYFFARGRFEMDKLRQYALSRGGECRNGICDAPGATVGKRVSFFPLSSRVLVLASSPAPWAVYNVKKKSGQAWTGGTPEGPIWISLNGGVLAGEPSLPAGGRLFGKVLSETERTNFTAAISPSGMELRMRAFCRDTACAENVKAQLEGVTREFKAYFDRLGQQARSDDLSGLLLAGQFASKGTEVTGRWPLSLGFLQKLAGGGL